MTKAREHEYRVTRPNHVWVYGNDHSAWTQAVLLGLHEQGIPHTLVTVPPLSVFLFSGVMMPAAKLDDAPWLLDSERILVELGFSELRPDARVAMQKVFLSSGLRRVDHPWDFWRRFSYVKDGHPWPPRRLWNHFWRAFSMFYFSIVIPVGSRMRPRTEPEQLFQEFAFFQERLEPGSEFLGGDEPDTMDFQLFGQVQQSASIPGPSLAVLRDHPGLERLRDWIEAMQRRFSDYSHLYTARDFEPKLPSMDQSSTADRIFYWTGAAVMWISFPLTLPTVAYMAWRVSRKRLREPQLAR